MQLKALLEKHLHASPDVIQFAKDRKYEEAWIIPLESGKPSTQDVDDYLNKDNYDLLIVEYIWNSKIDDRRFVLTVFLDQNCQLKDHKTFINLCLEIFFTYDSFTNFINFFDQKIIGRPYLFLNSPETCNMSIFNHWLSVGPVDLWNQGEVCNFETVKQKIQSRPEIEKTKLNYQGLLFRFNISGKENGPVYGLKTPCCRKDGEEWSVDYNLASKWMKGVLNI